METLEILRQNFLQPTSEYTLFPFGFGMAN